MQGTLSEFYQAFKTDSDRCMDLEQIKEFSEIFNQFGKNIYSQNHYRDILENLFVIFGTYLFSSQNSPEFNPKTIAIVTKIYSNLALLLEAETKKNEMVRLCFNYIQQNLSSYLESDHEPTFDDNIVIYNSLNQHMNTVQYNEAQKSQLDSLLSSLNITPSSDTSSSSSESSDDIPEERKS